MIIMDERRKGVARAKKGEQKKLSCQNNPRLGLPPSKTTTTIAAASSRSSGRSSYRRLAVFAVTLILLVFALSLLPIARKIKFARRVS